MNYDVNLSILSSYNKEVAKDQKLNNSFFERVSVHFVIIPHFVNHFLFRHKDKFIVSTNLPNLPLEVWSLEHNFQFWDW